MSTIAIVKGAGSAGGTTTAVTLAGLLAEQGRTVRIIDLDKQANASYALDVDGSEPTISDVLLGSATIADAEVQTKIPGLTVIPASPDLGRAEIELTRITGGEQRLRRALEHAPPADVTFVDCYGSLHLLAVAALIVSDYALTVVLPTLKELSGVPTVEEFVAEVRDAYNPRLALGGIVPCAVPPSTAGKVYAMALDLLRESYGDDVTPAVRRSARVPEAYSHREPLHVFAPREAVTQDYRAVLSHLQARGVL